METANVIIEGKETSLRPARILVVEDERIVAMSLRKQLQSLGYEVVGQVPSGEAAVEKAGELRPDLVLMDIRLEGAAMDGVEAAAAIRRRFHLPVVFLTAYSNRDILERAKLTEPFGYILKPYEDRELLVAVEMALYKHRMERRLEEANEKLLTLSTTDALTGLKNRRAFEDRLNDEFMRATRYSLPLSLLILDVDHFKQYNDTFGHLAGDGVLKQLACILQKAARSTDLVARNGNEELSRSPTDVDCVARFGGEEFAIVLTNTGREGAMIVAERLRRTVAEVAWQGKPVTVSIGVSTLREGIKEPSALVDEADAALYHCKAQGRNRVFHAADRVQSNGGPET